MRKAVREEFVQASTGYREVVLAQYGAGTREARSETNEAAVDIAARLARAIIRSRVGPSRHWICRDLCASVDLMRFRLRPECTGQKNHQK